MKVNTTFLLNVGNLLPKVNLAYCFMKGFYYKHFFFLSLVLLFFSTITRAQEFVMPKDSTITLCEGILLDPGGNSNYPNNVFGSIVRLVPSEPGSYLSLNFEEFEIEPSNDLLYVYDGNFASENDVDELSLIGAFSGLQEQKPNDITATNTEGALTLIFYSDEILNGKGFKINIICNASLEMVQGNLGTVCSGGILSPGGFSGYPANTDITSTFYAESRKQLTLNFLNFDLSSGDSLFIYNGENTQATRMAAYGSSDKIPPGVISQNANRALTLRFVSDGSNEGTGFQALVNCISNQTLDMRNGQELKTCGLIFRDPGGNRNYPNLKGNKLVSTFYPTNVGDKLSVIFNSLNIEPADEFFGTVYDYLEIYDGTTIETAPRLVQLSGSPTVRPITASNPEGALTFVFESDEIATGTGWEAVLSCVSPITMSDTLIQKCNTLFTDPGGVGNYPANSTTTTVFQSPSLRDQIQIDFTSFDLSIGDTLYVYNGTSVNENQRIGTFHQGGTPPSLFSNGNTRALTLHFVSDAVGTASGWEGKTTCVEGRSIKMFNNARISVCDAFFEDQGGDKNYADNLEQETTFLPNTEGDKVRINFGQFHVEEEFDYLNIYDGTSTAAPRIGTYTGKIDNFFQVTATNPEGALTLRFVSDGSGNESGWRSLVECITPAKLSPGSFTLCESFFTDDGGATQNYSENANIVTTLIPSDPQKKHKVTFNSFDVGTGDQLEVYQGQNVDTQNLIGTYSGNQLPPVLLGDQNTGSLTFRFISDGNNSAAGWDAKIECISKDEIPMTTGIFTGCQFRFTDNAGEEDYTTNQNVTTTFLPNEAGKQLRIVFNEFSTEENFDILNIYNGTSINSNNLIATLSGDNIPAPITANNADGALTFEFVSDEGVNGLGWDASVSCVAATAMTNTVSTTCNTFFVDPGGTQNYLPNQNITQTFVAEEGQLLANFENIELAEGDILNIYDGTTTNDLLIATLSTTESQFFASSTQGSFTFQFISNGTEEAAGWEAQLSCWSQFRECGEEFTDPGGAVGNYPLEALLYTTYYPQNEGERVRVIFSEFDLGEFSYLQVYNGEFDDPANLLYELTEGSVVPNDITSSDPTGALTFVFNSISGFPGKGWKADIQCFKPLLMADFQIQSCSSILLDSGGDRPYRNNENFTATIYPFQGNNGQQKNVSSLFFNSFDLGEGDTLYIYNGEQANNNRLLGKFSGKDKPPFIFANNASGALTYRFVSDGSNVGNGWEAEIACYNGQFSMATTTVYTCGIQFLDPGGLSEYSNASTDTVTFFPTVEGAKIVAAFGELALEEDFDYLYVYDGPTADDNTLLAALTGSTTPDPFVASNTEGALTFVFVSDEIVSDEGWGAFISCIQPLVMENGNVSTCNSIFYDPGSFDKPYPTQQDFITTISPTINSNISISFNEFDLAEGDTLYIYDGEAVNEDLLIGAYSAFDFPGFIFGTQDSGALTFHLTARSEQPGNGWSAIVLCFDGAFPMADNTLVGCGLNFQDSGGNDNYSDESTITSTFLPSNPGDKVSVEFKSFSLEEGFDFLYVYDGADIDTASFIQALTGEEIPATITASNPEGALTFQFISDESVNQEGWTADIMCIDSKAMEDGLVLDACQKVFLDPGGLGNYPNLFSGVSVIRASTPNRLLKLTFNQLDISAGDTLFVFNGTEITEDNLIGAYSGIAKPITIISDNTNALSFVFISDDSNNASGWDALIECVEPGTFQTITPDYLSGIVNGDADWGDYDGDGDLDLLVVGIDTNVDSTTPIAKVFKNKGGGIFEDVNAFLLDGVYNGAVAWEDYNSDGLLDITITGTNQFGIPTSIVYRNEIQKDDGTFVDIGANLTGLEKGSIRWADFDLDGDKDLLITGTNIENSRKFILYKNQNGIFGDQMLNVNNFDELNVHWGDYDHDGDLDILTSVFIYKNQAVENNPELFTRLQVRTIFDNDEGFSDWADFDQDGDLDVFLSFYQDTDGTVSNRLYENQGNDSFSQILLTLNEGESENNGGLPSVIDFIGDGNVDVSYSTLLQPAFWSIPNANSGIPFTKTSNFKEGFSELTWADYDGDNDPDLIVQPYGVSDVLPDFSDEEGFLQEPGIQFYENQLADSRNNQKPEAPSKLKVQQFNNEVVLSWEAGKDDFTPPSVLSYNLYIYEENAINYAVAPNADVATGIRFKPDRGNVGNKTTYKIRGLKEGNYVFAVQTIDAANNASVFSEPTNFKISNFVEVASGLLGEKPFLYQDITWGDYDNDGDFDLLLSGVENQVNEEEFESATPVVKIFTNSNSDLEDTTPDNLLQLSDGVTEWVDYNNDGLLDVFITGIDQLFQVQSQLYRLDPNEGLIPVNTGIKGMISGATAWGDYDNDGDLDVYITGQDSNFAIFSALYRNDGNDVFTEIENANLVALLQGDASWEDFDSDGDADLLVMGAAEEGLQLTLRTVLYRNEGGGNFSEVKSPLPNVFNGSVDWGDFDNDGDPDILINGSLSKDGSSRIAQVFENFNGEVFQQLTSANLKEISGKSIWGDYDNDGNSDILLYDPTTETSTLYRNEEDFFAENTLESTKKLGNGSISWTDFNRDRRLDIFLAGNRTITSEDREVTQNEVALFTSALVSADSPPPQPGLFSTDTLQTSALLEWDAFADEGYSYNVVLIRNGAEIIMNPLVNDQGLRTVLARGNAGYRDFQEINNLEDGAYQWAVQAISPSYTGGQFSETGDFIICDRFNRLAPVEFNINVSEIGPGGEVEFSAASSGLNIIKWEWDFGDGTSGEGEVIKHVYENAGTFEVKLTITNAIGCVKEGLPVSLTVSNSIPIRVANVVTPNGDNQNDFLQIDNIASYPDNTLTILNMWGQVVYETTQYQNDWQGVDQDGNALPAGNYITILKLNNIDSEPFKTTITILR